MPGLIRAGAVGPAAKPAKSVERASRPPPLVAQASSLCAAPARCGATIDFLKQPCRVRIAHLGHAQARRLCHQILFSGISHFKFNYIFIIIINYNILI